jgi:hypothetical protein
LFQIDRELPIWGIWLDRGSDRGDLHDLAQLRIQPGSAKAGFFGHIIISSRLGYPTPTSEQLLGFFPVSFPDIDLLRIYSKEKSGRASCPNPIPITGTT